MLSAARRARTLPRGRDVAIALAVWVVAAVPNARAHTPPAGPTPDRQALARHVATLASPDFGGRRGEGGRRAARYLTDHFQRLGLEPLFGDSYEQPVESKTRDGRLVRGSNVGAVLRGSDPVLREEWIIVSAHYDHLGITRGGVYYPGADDNASGVAMLLELARCLKESADSSAPKRSVAFIGFDLEEFGLLGSKHFAEHPPWPLNRVSLFITADMIGRSLAGVCDEYVFVMGTEYTPGLKPCVDRAAAGLELKAGVVGSDLLLFDRSDYGPFRKRKIPFLFFSTGESNVYHTPEDRPETLNYEKLAQISTMVERVVLEAASAPDVPKWSDKPVHDLDEAVAVLDVLRLLLENSDRLAIKPVQSAILKAQIHDLEDAVEQGQLSPGRRRRMVLNAQLVLYSVL